MYDLIKDYLWIIYIAAAILAALLLLIILMRTLGGRVRGRRGSRLGISEYYEIDKTRRLVLVRRDDTEHLLLIGGGEDLVVENNITSPLVASAPTPMRDRPVAPRPAVFGAARRPTLRPVDPNQDEN
jgi:hypothetical protein